MGRTALSGLRLFPLALLGAVPWQVAAQDSIAGTAHAAEDAALEHLRRSDWRRVSSREAINDWGTGGVSLRGSRVAEGRKRVEFLTPPGVWRRSYRGEIRAWSDVTSEVALEANLVISRDSNGRNGAPLLTTTSRGNAASASLALRADNGVSLKLGMFDRYGWSGQDLADTANRLNNGEGPAQRGVAASWSFSAADVGAGKRDDRRFGVTLERAVYADGETANAGRFEARVIF